MLLVLVCGACTSSTASHHASKAGAHKRSAGVVRIHASFLGGPLDPKTHRGVFDNKPVRNVQFSVIGSNGRHWRGRTSGAGARTFKLWPGRYVITSNWCGVRRTQIKVVPERILPVRFACPVR